MTKKEAIRQTHQENVLLELGFTRAEAESLRRISLTLHRWFEHECNGAIQRDGDNGDGRPYWFNTETGRKIGPAPDREAGAMRRLAAIIEARNARHSAQFTETCECGDKVGHISSCDHGRLAYFIQSDPRGGTLYILRPGDVPAGKSASSYYTNGVCVY